LARHTIVERDMSRLRNHPEVERLLWFISAGQATSARLPASAPAESWSEEHSDCI
jgi:hypothetical protein